MDENNFLQNSKIAILQFCEIPKFRNSEIPKLYGRPLWSPYGEPYGARYGAYFNVLITHRVGRPQGGDHKGRPDGFIFFVDIIKNQLSYLLHLPPIHK
jgi:hypothetical protein